MGEAGYARSLAARTAAKASMSLAVAATFSDFLNSALNGLRKGLNSFSSRNVVGI